MKVDVARQRDLSAKDDTSLALAKTASQVLIPFCTDVHLQGGPSNVLFDW